VLAGQDIRDSQTAERRHRDGPQEVEDGPGAVGDAVDTVDAGRLFVQLGQRSLSIAREERVVEGLDSRTSGARAATLETEGIGHGGGGCLVQFDVAEHAVEAAVRDFTILIEGEDVDDAL